MNSKNRNKGAVISVMFAVGVLIALAATLASTLSIVHALIEHLLTDTESSWFDYSQTLRWGLPSSIAIFLVFSPLLFYCTKKTKASIAQTSEETLLHKLQNVAVAIIVTASILILAISTVVFLSAFLTGGLTTQFALKLAATVLLGGFVLVYYRAMWRQKFTSGILNNKLVLPAVLVFSLLMVIAGIYLINPSKARARNSTLDTLMEMDYIHQELQARQDGSDPLPSTLAGINRTPIHGVEYTKLSDSRYEICATLDALPIGEDYHDYPYGDFPYDEVGRHCFEFSN